MKRYEQIDGHSVYIVLRIYEEEKRVGSKPSKLFVHLSDYQINIRDEGDFYEVVFARKHPSNQREATPLVYRVGKRDYQVRPVLR